MNKKMNLQDKLKYLKEVAREANEIHREDEFRSLIDALEIAVSALDICANRGDCKSYECCASCGPIYEAESAIEQIKTKLGCV